MPGPVLAIDVGGTKLSAAVVEPDGVIRTRGWVTTPPGAPAGVVTGALHAVVRQVTQDAPASRLAGVGIGSAGPLDPAGGTISPVNIPAWQAFPIVEELRALVPDRPVTLAGDGHCMALGEYWRGGGRPIGPGHTTMLGITVSTGVGGGLIINGRVHAGPTGNAGHVGHIVVDMAGPPCSCGGRGCVEALASGPAIARWATGQGWSPGARPADARTLAADARAGQAIARAAFARAGDALAAAIVSAAALIDLDVVVVGGGVSQAGDLLFQPLRDGVADRAGMAFIRRVRIHPSPLGNDAGLLGAAALALDATATARSGNIA